MDLPTSRYTLLVVDDEPVNLAVMRTILAEEYRLLFAKDGATAISLAEQEKPDLILLDIMMPVLSGYEVCDRLKANPDTQFIPIIFVTALSDSNDEYLGLEKGAVDYIAKPFHNAIVKARIRTHLSLVQAKEVYETHMRIIQSLGMAAGYRDNETGNHIIRISHFAQQVALAAGCSAKFADTLFHAAPMHDVGKIGIPDAILLKPGKLTPEEWEIMRQHTTIGAQIIGDHHSPLLKMAALIARTHHEKWDGSGYPCGLAGESIPLEARIIALVDVFDALTSERPYKKAWPAEEALAYIQAEKGKHFDPNLVDVFVSCFPRLLAIRQQWLDTH